MAGRGAAPGRRAAPGLALGGMLALGLAAPGAAAQEAAAGSPPPRPAVEAGGTVPTAEPVAAEAVAAPDDAAEAPGADGAASAAGAATLGPVTGLPLPRFVSLRASEARARRGPGLDHRVDWLYRLPGLPLLVTAEHGHWRRVEDIEGQGGWVHYSLISGERSVVVTGGLADLHRRPEEGSPVVARLETGVVASLDGCREGWCEVEAQGYRGWARDAGLWGVGEEEAVN